MCVGNSCKDTNSEDYVLYASADGVKGEDCFVPVTGGTGSRNGDVVY